MYSHHPYMIWTNELDIHACTKPEDLIKNNNQRSSIFICVCRQKRSNLHIPHRVVACTKRRHNGILTSQIVSPNFFPSHKVSALISKYAHTCIPVVVQCWMCAIPAFRLFTRRMFLLILLVYGDKIPIMSCHGHWLNTQQMTGSSPRRPPFLHSI